MNRKSFNEYWDRYSTFVILIVMVGVFAVLAPDVFFTPSNLIRITEQSSLTILVATGEFFAILLAGIDLSVGSVMALTGVTTAMLMVNGVPPILAVLLGSVLLGAFLGAVNGTLISVTKLPPFIITLGTMSIYRGVTLSVTNARAVSGLPVEFTRFVGGRVFGYVPMPIIIALAVAGFLTWFSLKTKPGRNIYAIGGNAESAWFAGINVRLHTILVFTISGICAGLAGMVNIARLGAAEPNAGIGFEVFAIAAVIIGGTSFFGGQGVIPKVVVGGLIIGVINNGLNMVGVSAFYQQIAMGCLIIAAVTLDRFFGTGGKAKR